MRIIRSDRIFRFSASTLSKPRSLKILLLPTWNRNPETRLPWRCRMACCTPRLMLANAIFVICSPRLNCARSPANRQHAHANSRILDHDDGALLECLAYCRQIRGKDRELPLRPAAGALPEKDHRRLRLLPPGKDRAEIGVGRHDDPVFVHRTHE